MSSKSGSRWWLIAGAALAIALATGTRWLLTKQTRGAEIPNVLALPVTILGVVAAIGAVVVAVRSQGPGDENLTSAAQSREVSAALGPRVSTSVGDDEQQEATTKLAGTVA
jgi:predicted PurR-regulated permease PerM